MKINKFKKLIATVGATALISSGLVVAVAAPAQAADPVCGRGSVEARQDKEAGVGAGVGSGLGRAWWAEGSQGLGGGLVHDSAQRRRGGARDWSSMACRG